MKFVKYIIIVIVSVVIFDFAITYCFESIMKNRYNNQIYSTYSSSSDMAILGASRAAHHYDPQVIGDSLHLKVINYGIDGQNIFTQYIVLKSIMEHSQNKPEIVLLEINSIDVNNTPKWNTEKLNVLFPYFHSEGYVRDLLKDVLSHGEYWSLKLFGLYRHNSKHLTYLHHLFLGFPVVSDGFSPRYNRWDKPIERVENLKETIYPKKVEYLEKFIALCKQENIQLIIAVSPNFKQLPKQDWVEKVRQVTKKENVPFLYHEKDTLFLSHGEWFNEPFHLNDVGAQIYSSIICGEISEILSIDK